MAVPVLNLKVQYAEIRDRIDAAVHQVLESGQFVLGPNVSALSATLSISPPFISGLVKESHFGQRASCSLWVSV